MYNPKIWLATAFLTVASISLFGQATASTPCVDNPLVQKLDFWLGDWEVYVADTLSAYSKITKAEGNCTLHEDYQTTRGYAGRSMNYFDPADSLYKQVWVDKLNGLIRFQEVRAAAGYLLMEAVGSPQPLRMDYRLDTLTGFVTQTMESSQDNGATWVSIFNGEYRPRVQIPTTAEALLAASRQYHDPNKVWPNWQAELQVEEPRLQNPGRATKLVINNGLSVFRMERAYGENLLGFYVTPAGCTYSLNGNTELGPETLSEHRLNCSRARNYRGFYRFLYGLPMILDEMRWEALSTPALSNLRGQSLIKLEVSIADAPFSSRWSLYFDPASHQLRALEYFPEAGEGDLLILEDEFEKGGIKLHRIRHWYEGEAYQGSDIGF
ncbi:MAG: DUF6503 family protein [Bacteroidota bacterium]